MFCFKRHPIDDVETHRLNYRMAFDAMRAYHSSEIEHKKDMIAVLNSILLTVISVYAGIFYLIFTQSGDINKWLFLASIITIAFLYFLLIYHLKVKNVQKLKGDNDRYEKFREECLIERHYLGLTAFFDKNKENRNVLYWDQQKKTAKKQRPGTGYLKTIVFINIYCNMLIIMITFASLVACLLLITKYYNL